jgi:guanylate kinase
MKGQLYIISAPSGAGKTSLVSALVNESADIAVSISHTTRKKRPGEHDGVNYHFVDQAEFDHVLKEGGFLESAQVFDNCYGTSSQALESQLNAGVDVILEIDWQGARQIREKRPDCCSVFILPPSHDELEQRLNRRGEDDAATVQRRMRDAVAEIIHYKEYDYLVINDDFQTALSDLKTIVRANRLKSAPQQKKNLALLNDLLEQ